MKYGFIDIYLGRSPGKYKVNNLPVCINYDTSRIVGFAHVTVYGGSVTADMHINNAPVGEYYAIFIKQKKDEGYMYVGIALVSSNMYDEKNQFLQPISIKI